MEIVFCKNLSENKRMTKKLEGAMTVNGEFRNNGDTASVRNPVISLATNIIGYNYAYIPTFNRYYYVGDPKILPTGIYTVQLTEDVLMSWADGILNCYAVIDKQQIKNDPYIDDRSIVTENRRWHTVINFPTGLLDTPTYILMTVGDGHILPTQDTDTGAIDEDETKEVDG